MKKAGRFTLVEEYLQRSFVEQPFDSALRELHEWGRWLDPLDKEQVRVMALPPVRRALGADAPPDSAERLVDAALELGAAELAACA